MNSEEISAIKVLAPAQRMQQGDGQPGDMNHVVQFYEDDAFLCDTVARFLGAGIVAGDPVVVIATDLRRHAFIQRMRANHLDADAALASGQLTMLDARETLAQFMVGDMPDWERFTATVGSVLERIAGTRGRARAYGEMVDLLWRDGNAPGAIRLEEMWNDLGKHYQFSLLCAYVMDNFYKEDDAQLFKEVCRAHAHVVPSDSYSKIDEPKERLREISVLQQRALALQTEVERRKQAEARLAQLLSERTEEGARSQQRFRLLVESVGDYAIFMLDPNGFVASWNIGAERIKGYRADEIIGQHFSRFYPADDVRAGKCEHELEIAARDGRFEDEGWRVRKDGSRFWANVVITRMLGSDGKLVGFAKVTRDLTERRRLQDEQIARASAENVVRFNELFVGILGHDLRNPMSAIAMGASLLLRSVGTEKEMKVTRRIAASAERMARMIDQLLDFTRMRIGGGLVLNRERTNLFSLCQRVVEELETAHPECTLSLEFQGQDSTGEWDGDRILQALSNLVGNAINHGAVGRPVRLRVEGHEERVSVLIRNEGVVPPDILPVLFDPFRGSQRKERKGLGLGLYITQQIVVAHGGTVNVASSETEGTTFCIDLPRSVSGGTSCIPSMTS